MIERLNILQGNQLDEQLELWNKQNSTVLPLGKGEINGVFPHYHLSIRWGKSIGEAGCLEIDYRISTV
jgi:hypothetical protein